MGVTKDGYAKTIEQMGRELTKVLASSEYDIPKQLFHYSDSAGLIGILEQLELWATHYDCLNDSSELTLAKSLVRSELSELSESGKDGISREFANQIRQWHTERHLTSYSELFILSFSQEEDDLSQWRAYGVDGNGYAVGFTISPDSAGEIASGLPCLLTGCLYDSDALRERVKKLVLQSANFFEKYIVTYPPPDEESAELLFQEAASSVMAPIAYQEMGFKNPYFRTEREWRLCLLHDSNGLRRACSFRPTSSGVVPYCPVKFKVNDPTFRISKVIVGPRGDQARRIETVRWLLNRHGIDDCNVVGSEIPYRGR